jgi:hypothetical protein
MTACLLWKVEVYNSTSFVSQLLVNGFVSYVHTVNGSVEANFVHESASNNEGVSSLSHVKDLPELLYAAEKNPCLTAISGACTFTCGCGSLQLGQD